jgi:hypothetical protein
MGYYARLRGIRSNRAVLAVAVQIVGAASPHNILRLRDRARPKRGHLV